MRAVTRSVSLVKARSRLIPTANNSLTLVRLSMSVTSVMNSYSRLSDALTTVDVIVVTLMLDGSVTLLTTPNVSLKTMSPMRLTEALQTNKKISRLLRNSWSSYQLLY